ncbi:unnamed protein product [Schistosoma margrebowiei]|uniref:Uncharacterized protein n=1 Tax=Schistosoma margrebowiei TaxID=48269 RepID=A0A183LPB7_9TREM|nr:unnamed protein product [Schistosoma margrebowiei]
MKTATSEGKYGIQWTAQNQLDYSDFTDDLALLSNTHEQMQMKTTSVATASVSISLNMHKEKINIFKYNTENTNPITLDGESLEDEESFTYLVGIIDVEGESAADLKVRIGKARATFLQLKNIWNSKKLSINIKVKIFNTNVNTVLLYEAELPKSSSNV